MNSRLHFGKPNYVELVVAVVVVWGFCDGLSTLLAASFAGAHLEANPFIRGLLPTPSLAFGVKLLGALAAGLLALAGERFIRTVPGWRLWFASLIAAGVLVTALNLAVAFSLV